MKESIYTIPISEVFEPKCGCPICSLYNTLESKWVEYITGAAMMEPDIRVETNRQGFCIEHFKMMLGQKNRLSVALILQSRLEYIDETLITETAPKAFFAKNKKDGGNDGCFVCAQINREYERIGGNIAGLWKRESDFRALYSGQEFLCLTHYRMLEKAGRNELDKKNFDLFINESARLTRNRLKSAKSNIDEFCNLFDYRNAGSAQPPREVASAIESAIEYLTGEAL